MDKVPTLTFGGRMGKTQLHEQANQTISNSNKQHEANKEGLVERGWLVAKEDG